MKLLALETATEACSCALLAGDELHERFEVAPRRHAELLLGMVAGLLESAEVPLAELDAIAFGRGPGSFTGVRIATGVAQGLGFSAGVPLVAISSLHALAEGAARASGMSKVLAAFDARMDEVYWGAFSREESGLLTPVGAERVCAPSDVPAPDDGGWLGAGDGWAAHGDALRSRLGRCVDRVDAGARPRAGDLAPLAAAAFARGAACPAEEARPVYLRDQVVGRPRR